MVTLLIYKLSLYYAFSVYYLLCTLYDKRTTLDYHLFTLTLVLCLTQAIVDPK